MKLNKISCLPRAKVESAQRRKVLSAGVSMLVLMPFFSSFAQSDIPISAGSATSADGTNIGYIKVGSGPSLVVVHGSLDTGNIWMPVAQTLSEHFTCYLMDRRGRGTSGDSSEYSLEKECDDIKAVLDIAGPESYLLGHSYGAICALETAIRFPVAKLVLYEAPLPINGSVIPPEFKDYQLAVEQNHLGEALVIGFSKILYVPDEAIAAMRNSSDWDAMAALTPSWVRELQAIEQLEYGVARFAKMASPTLLLFGTATAAHHIVASNALEGILPNVRTVQFPGQGHDAHLTVTTDFAEAIMNFLL